jgi:hypothetical protein
VGSNESSSCFIARDSADIRAFIGRAAGWQAEFTFGAPVAITPFEQIKRPKVPYYSKKKRRK